MKTNHCFKKVIASILLLCIVFTGRIPVLAAANNTGSFSSSSIRYITPEQFGAKGDGITDDTEAFKKCMNSTETIVYLTKTYLIRDYITTNREKYFYATPKNNGTGATIICNPRSGNKTLAFFAGVTFENVEFYSTILQKGTSPHGETYARTSNTVFVEVWNQTGVFKNCSFFNALIAIRGRKSTNSTVIPKSIVVDKCNFTECKIPIQGYSEETSVSGSCFINDGELYRRIDNAPVNIAKYNGDLYGGDHCVYIERYGCKSLKVSDCVVETKNCASGAAFQIYGTPKKGDIIPDLTVYRCTLNANGVVSTSAANVTIQECSFVEQQDGKFIASVESGSLKLLNSTFDHSYAFTYANTNVKPYASNCTFRLMMNFGRSRCNFPFESYNCTYINWGGNVRLNNTLFSGCLFTREYDHTLNKLYISNKSGYSIKLRDTSFKDGDTVTDKTDAVKEFVNCKVVK